MAWVVDNGFETDGIDEEFEVDPEESTIIDLDDNFPGKDLTPTQIVAIIKRCWDDPLAYTNEVAPLQVVADDFAINESEINKSIELYEKQCPNLFKGGMKGDKALMRMITVSEKIGEPYLLWLCDMYSRDRLMRTTDNLSVQSWGASNRHIKELRFLKNANHDPRTEALSAVESFFHRINPKLMFNPQIRIKDSLKEASQYITAACEFVAQLANQPQLACPFQVDMCLVFNETINCEQVLQPEPAKPQASEEDDEDDDDEYGGQEDQKEDDEDDGLGDIKKRIKANKLPHVVTALNSKPDDRNGVRMFREPYNKFASEKINEKYKKDNDMYSQYPRKHRCCTLIDRRKPKKGKDASGIAEEDELIIWEPPTDCNTFPDEKDRGYVPFWFFDSTRTCIVPNDDYDDMKSDIDKQLKSMKDVVTSKTGANGKLITLSFHVESDVEIRAYWYINGQVARFLPMDILYILPQFFDPKVCDNHLWLKSKDAREMMHRIKKGMKDIGFEAFYNEYRCKDSLPYNLRY
eukprot:415754_1